MTTTPTRRTATVTLSGEQLRLLSNHRDRSYVAEWAITRAVADLGMSITWDAWTPSTQPGGGYARLPWQPGQQVPDHTSHITITITTSHNNDT